EMTIVLVIHDAGDAADHVAIAAGDKCLNLADLLKGMFLPADQPLEVIAQRRNPVRVVAVQIPGKPHESPAIAPPSHGLNNHIRHRKSLVAEELPAFSPAETLHYRSGVNRGQGRAMELESAVGRYLNHDRQRVFTGGMYAT